MNEKHKSINAHTLHFFFVINCRQRQNGKREKFRQKCCLAFHFDGLHQAIATFDI